MNKAKKTKVIVKRMTKAQVDAAKVEVLRQLMFIAFAVILATVSFRAGQYVADEFFGAQGKGEELESAR